MIVNRSLLSLFLAALSNNGIASSVSAEKVPLRGLRPDTHYEVWGSDQSNSVSGEGSAGVKGSYIWIWDSNSIEDQLDGNGAAKPLSCTPDKTEGPCDLLDVFPQDLTDDDGNALGDLPGFGRLHGMSQDPTNQYMTANIFTPSGGFVGVIDTETKEAIALFRVSATTGNINERSVHMSVWTADGSAILVDNLHGKMIERIDVTRNAQDKITNLKLNQSAAVYLGKNFKLLSAATVFKGKNAFGNVMIGQVVGNYGRADIGDLTPAGVCKESGCGGTDPSGGDRPNNMPICPSPSINNNVYVTLGGGGFFVLKSDTTPMQIVGEYGDEVVNGAGCGGVQSGDMMFMNAGVSASGAGDNQSTFTVYGFNDTLFRLPKKNEKSEENVPDPVLIFKDATNTNTIGNVDGVSVPNESGQKPSVTTRRDSHGAVVTADGAYLHVGDRIQNVIEVFETTDPYTHVGSYDLTVNGACGLASVTDDATFETNDPAPDGATITPDGKYIMIALRGPKPVSVNHAAQGSCPGVGIIELTDNGASGVLVGVLRSSNTVDTVPIGSIPGGYAYSGSERSDVHGATVVARNYIGTFP